MGSSLPNFDDSCGKEPIVTIVPFSTELVYIPRSIDLNTMFKYVILVLKYILLLVHNSGIVIHTTSN